MADSFDLPPSIIAQPLPVGKNRETAAKRRQQPHSKQRRDDDDTPKSFARLMQFKRTGRHPNGLDNGNVPRGQKRKRGQASNEKAVAEDTIEGTPKILPGERLADFAARVDQALPVGRLAHKGKHVDGIKDRETQHNKRLRKMQAAWRKEEARVREKEIEAREQAEEEEDERNALFEDKTLDLHARQGKGKRRSTADGDEDDPWAVLARREQPKGLHDVAQAPPQFKRLPKQKFKVRNGAMVDVIDIPNAAGSLRRREALGETRKNIIESYRTMMESKRT